MKIEASAGRDKKADVRDSCYSLRISSDDPRDKAAIAVIYRLVAGLRISGIDNWHLNQAAHFIDLCTDQLLRESDGE